MGNTQTFKQGCGALCSYMLEPGIKLQLRSRAGAGKLPTNTGNRDVPFLLVLVSPHVKLLSQAQL